MDFTVKDRILLLNGVLPQFDSMAGIIVKMAITDKLKLSEEENSGIVINRLPTGVMEVGFKNPEMPLSVKDISLTDEELFYIKTRVRMVDANGMVSSDNIDTYQKVLEASFEDESYREKWEEKFPG
jgi:hypothetical protein